jgi:hypothetical protein
VNATITTRTLRRGNSPRQILADRCIECSDKVGRGALRCAECDQELRVRRTGGHALATLIFAAGKSMAWRQSSPSAWRDWAWRPQAVRT